LPVVFPILYGVLPWIHFYDSLLTTPSTTTSPESPGEDASARKSARVSYILPKNPHKDKMKPKTKYKATECLKFYFTAPVTKFHYSMVGTSCFTDVLDLLAEM